MDVNKTTDKKIAKTERNKKGSKKSAVLIIAAWILFAAGAAGFVIVLKHTESTKQDDSASKFSYQTNSNLEINALISDYYAAMVACNQEELKSLVTNPAAFDDMTQYQQYAKIRNAYTNINCYSVDGYNQNETLIYVTSNVSIIGISSRPMDIQTFYIVRTSDGKYIIDNSELSPEVKAYIDDVQADKDIQELYMAVKKDVEACKNNDPAFAELWDKLYGY